MSRDEPIAGRTYAPAYRVSGRADILDFLCAAVGASGGRVISTSSPARAPFYLGVEIAGGDRMGLLVYPFRSSTERVLGRAANEHRVQIRYGGESTWSGDHPVGVDPAGVDVTLVLGVNLSRDVLIGLDPSSYSPLPMGISFEYKEPDVKRIRKLGWHVWSRENRPGRRRAAARVDGLETVIGFSPSRLLDYARFEREATGLGLDPPLRFRAAEASGNCPGFQRHALEQQFELPAEDILEIIGERTRLKVAVTGGVAERHLERVLAKDQKVRKIRPIDKDGQPDFEIEVSRRQLLVECKNVSPHPYANGDLKVEVQKTRATQADPMGRYYRFDQFDILAACVWAATGKWEFRFRKTTALLPHKKDPSRIYPYQRVDKSWARRISDL